MKNQKVPTMFGTILILILVITAGVFVYRIEKMDEAQIGSTTNPLQKKQEVKKVEQSSLKQTGSTQQEQVLSERRLSGSGCYAMKNGQIDKLNLREDFNAEPANTTVHYENKDVGISFDVPYNKQWGNKDCVVPPYFQFTVPNTKFIMEFGMPRAFLTSQFHFGTRDKRDPKSVTKKVEGGVVDEIPRATKIGNLNVVVYISVGEVDSMIIEVPAKNFDYFFEEIAPKIQNRTSVELQNIIKTTKISEVKQTTLKKSNETNRFVYYDGEITVSGYYVQHPPNSMLEDLLLFYADKETGYLVPGIPNQYGIINDSRVVWFRFSNQDEAKAMFKITDKNLFPDKTLRDPCIKGKATVKISHYVVDKLEAAVISKATLEKVISKEKYSLMNECRIYN